MVRNYRSGVYNSIKVQILDNISKVKILVAGDVMLDRYWWGSVNRISPEAPVPIVQLEKMSLVAGGAANVAANLAGLGATPYLFGIKGVDAEGGAVDEVLLTAGIENHSIYPLPGRKTTIKTRIVAHSQHVVRIDQETTDQITNSQAENIISDMSETLKKVDAVIISDYAKGFLSDYFLKIFIDEARSLNKLLIVDPKGRDFSRYRGASVITPNKREAAEAASLEPDSPDLVLRSGNLLLDSLDLRALLITEGENGMTLFHNDGETSHLESLAHNVYDVTGAGDTVIATFTAAAATGAAFLDAAKLANAAAGLVVGKIGTTRVTREMLADFIASHESVQQIHA